MKSNRHRTLRNVTVAFVGALLAAASPAQASPPDDPRVVQVEPAPGTVIRRLTIPVRARVEGQGDLKVELVLRKGKEELSRPMRRLDDGRHGITIDAALVSSLGLADELQRDWSFVDLLWVRARDARGREHSVHLGLVNGTGFEEGTPAVIASGELLEPIEVRDLANKAFELPVATGGTVIMFYGTWDDCEKELAWLARVRANFPRLEVVGVGSVTPEDVPAWRSYLAEKRAAWRHVADTQGEVAEALLFGGPRRSIGNAARVVCIYVLVDRRIVASHAGPVDELDDELTDRFLPTG
ncbi:MAG: hypothetical protein KF878_11150 [Planctomycetes bacterium]|nr:hypothetical protein [Planctomycetota bacterium]